MKEAMILILILGVFVSCLKDNNLYVYRKALYDYKLTGKVPFFLHSGNKISLDSSNESKVCEVCALVVGLMIDFRKNMKINDTEFHQDVQIFCNLYSGYSERYCKGFATMNTPTFLYIIDHVNDINGTDVCAIAFQFNNCFIQNRKDWTVDIPSGITINKPEANSTKSFNILHISDIHYDPWYEAGKTNDCGEPICCENDQPDGNTTENTCGYWSDYINADIPWRTVENALQQTKIHDFDYVYFTGDIVPHRMWNLSQTDNVQIIAQVLDALDLHYNVPIYPCLGNHEANPANVYSEVKNSSVSSEWLFEVLLQKTSKWLPAAEVRETILKGGYYTVSPRKGLRVVVLNNNVCNVNNWWLIYNANDPYDQLGWLNTVLLKAEQNNERVHILHHIPSGRLECYKIWAREYRKIVERFSNTIAAQFNGHTHRDEFTVYYSTSNTDHAINVAWNGASVVTLDKANPSYKLLSINEETFDLLDFEEWTYNLTFANTRITEKPIWYKLYSFKDAYGVRSLEASEINDLILRMTKNHSLLDQYYRYKFRNSDIANKEGCDDNCKKNLLCDIVTTEYRDDTVCEQMKKRYDGALNYVSVTMV